MKKKKSGVANFDEYYSLMYKDDYNILKEALLEENKNIYEFKNNEKSYFLDKASKMLSDLLPIEDGYNLLDMCSAPGGKSLSIISRFNNTNTLVCNEINTNRRLRLLKVINEMVSSDLRDNIRITGYDASLWSQYEKNKYDAILCDVPCSSERHVLNNPKELQKWSKSRIKRITATQYAILCSALDAVKIGGYILYSTCSINKFENELLIEKLERKRLGRFIEVEKLLKNSTKLKYGSIILPTNSNGSGPLYYALLKRVN